MATRLQVKINTQEEYEWLAERLPPEMDPLKAEWVAFSRDLRRQIQRHLFGKQSPENDVKFYHWIWDHSNQTCEETQTPLHNYSAQYISHILTRGGHTEMRYDPRNVNVLRPEAHRAWEDGKLEERMQMAIWGKNQRTIQNLKREYQHERN
jgi:hypothetical protein